MNRDRNENTLIQDLTTGSVSRQLLLFAAPLFFSGLLQTVYSMVDMIVVGHYVGSGGLVAVSNGGEILSMLTLIAIGISNAGQIIISQHIGAGKREQLGRLIGTMSFFLLLSAAVMTCICLIIRNQIVGWLHTPEESLEYALSYITVCAVGLVFIYGYNLVSAIFRGMGDSRHPFVFVSVASLINIVLDLLFVAVFDLAAFGAALATVLSQSFSFIFALVFLYRNRRKMGFMIRRRDFRLDMQSLYELLKLGIPMAIQSAAVIFSKLFITSWVNQYGVIASAVTSIGNKLSTFMNIVAQAFSTAGGSMIAQNLGAGKYDRVPKVIGVSMVFNGVIAVGFSFVTLTWPDLVFGIFTGEAEVLAMAYSYIPVALLLYASSVVRPPMFALINGSGHSTLNLSIGLLDGIVMRIGFAYFLGVICGLGIMGFWIGDAMSGFVPFVVGGIFFVSGRWKKDNYV